MYFITQTSDYNRDFWTNEKLSYIFRYIRMCSSVHTRLNIRYIQSQCL